MGVSPSSHLARVSANIPASSSQLRKLSEPMLNGRPEDLDILANELTRIGRQQQNGSASPPPPAPPPRDASISSVPSSIHSNGDISSPVNGTLLSSEPAKVRLKCEIWKKTRDFR